MRLQREQPKILKQFLGFNTESTLFSLFFCSFAPTNIEI